MEEWIGVYEASKLSGKSLSTVRRWCDGRVVQSRKRKDGRKILKSSLLSYLVTEATVTPAQKNQQPYQESSDGILQEKNERIRELKEENRNLREQVQTLQQELFRNTHELRAILSQQTGTTPSAWKRTTTRDSA